MFIMWYNVLELIMMILRRCYVMSMIKTMILRRCYMTMMYYDAKLLMI